MNNSDGISPGRSSFADSRYPQGHLPGEAKQGEIVIACIHCGSEFGLKRWDSWNGFLVRCPHCGGLHGKRWKRRNVLLASFFLNAFSFLFTMRPKNALLSLSGFVVFAVVGNYLLDSGKIPDILEFVGALVIVLGPMLVNAVVLIKHQIDLDNSAPPIRVLQS